MRKPHIALAVFVALGLLVAACGLPALALPKSFDNPLTNPAEKTAAAVQTQYVIQTVIANMTATLPPLVEARIQTATLAPSSTPITPTATGTRRPPTSTPLPPTATPAPCNAARFVADLTILDGEIINTGTETTKIWRLMNVGTCIWTTDFTVVHVSGEPFGVTEPTPLPKIVLPGEMVNVSVKVVIPNQPGSYTGYFQLKTDSGVLFGLGATASKSFWIRVNAVQKGSEPGVIYDLAKNACSARWSSENLDPVRCPSIESPNGGVFTLKAPKLEGGRVEDEPAIITIPSAGKTGYILGVFPSISVRAGNRFKSIIGCLANSDDCSVTFKLQYSTDDGLTFQELGSWPQVEDGSWQKLDIDLSPLAGKQVVLALKVLDNGEAVEDRAFWLSPKVYR